MKDAVPAPGPERLAGHPMSATAKRARRPSALASRDHVETEREQVERLLAERAALRARILAAVKDAGEAYSVEIAAAVGRPLLRVAGQLKQLERAGALGSRFEPLGARGCKSGLGRRYYRAAAP